MYMYVENCYLESCPGNSGMRFVLSSHLGERAGERGWSTTIWVGGIKRVLILPLIAHLTALDLNRGLVTRRVCIQRLSDG